MSWRAVNDEAPYRKVSKQSEGLEGFLRGDTVKVEASQDPGAKKRGVRSHRKSTIRDLHTHPNPLVFFSKKLQLRWYQLPLFLGLFGPKT